MFINVKWLRPRTFAWNWRADQNILLVGLWFVAVGFDLGLTKSGWYKHFNRKCLNCGQPLKPVSRIQRVYFHRQCRTEGRKKLRTAQ